MKETLEILESLSTEQKAKIVMGANSWETVETELLPKIWMSDGPHGLRKEINTDGVNALGKTAKATCFPPASLSSCSFDRELIAELATAIAEEAICADVDIVLGPALNIKRTALCGRNYEYVSEDPYLTAEFAVSYTDAMQKKGVGVCLKHFALNNQETYRMRYSAEVDTRALREIYLYAFEECVKRSKPYTIMSAYNRIYGDYASESKLLLTDLLRKEWGFDGAVISDWAAIDDRVKALKAGCDLEMPYSGSYRAEEILNALAEGDLSMDELDKAVINIINMVKRCVTQVKEKTPVNRQTHLAIARRVAERSIVLLKNDGILPLNGVGGIGVLDPFYDSPKIQGGGSGHTETDKCENAFDALAKKGINVRVIKGCSLKANTLSEDERKTAEVFVRSYDRIILNLGLPDSYEYEGRDRDDLLLPQNQRDLLKIAIDSGKKVIVTLCCGSAVDVRWVDSVNALVYGGVGGEAGGSALANVLSGEVNPSGKLSESFPYAENYPFGAEVLGGNNAVHYKESIFVGYRYYQSANVPTLFPFGFGLSYTDFSVENVRVTKLSGDYTYEVACDVTNRGKVSGEEVVQLYVSHRSDKYYSVDKQLKGFSKVFLEPGETKQVKFTTDFGTFKHYDIDLGWCVDEGAYSLLVGNSSQNIVGRAEIEVKGVQVPERTVDYLKGGFTEESFARVCGFVPQDENIINRQFDGSSVGLEMKRRRFGRRMYKMAVAEIQKTNKNDAEAELGLIRALDYTPLRAMCIFSGGMLNYGCVKPIVKMLKTNSYCSLIELFKSKKRYK
ncbi:MAG: glycoside hydrolase family 3 N-terminal domain-containing protein [Clostridia bacterium]|nr:glycoside hydrolase family 3 N-terminal domain-containing protein [Clostridia bacterium]